MFLNTGDIIVKRSMFFYDDVHKSLKLINLFVYRQIIWTFYVQYFFFLEGKKKKRKKKSQVESEAPDNSLVVVDGP